MDSKPCMYYLLPILSKRDWPPSLYMVNIPLSSVSLRRSTYLCPAKKKKKKINYMKGSKYLMYL